MTTTRLTVERDADVLLMGVNRPEKRNAFDLATIAALAAAYERLEPRATCSLAPLIRPRACARVAAAAGRKAPGVSQRR